MPTIIFVSEEVKGKETIKHRWVGTAVPDAISQSRKNELRPSYSVKYFVKSFYLS